MTASRLAWYAAITTAGVWAFKALAIWEAGGLGKTSLEDVGWAVGTLAFLVAWAALGFAFAAGRAVWLRVIAAAVGVVLGFALFAALDGAADLLPESTGWVHEEAGLWAVALVTLAVAWWQPPARRYGNRLAAVGALGWTADYPLGGIPRERSRRLDR